MSFSKQNLATQEYRNYKLVHGDGSKGLKNHKPYDRIIVTASAKRVPNPLMKQLAINGLLLIPVDNELLSIRKVGRDKFEQRVEEYVSFVPLIEE